MPFENNQGSPVNGVLLHENSSRSIKLTNHLDLPTLLPFAAQGGLTDLGVRDVYALSHREDVPFMLPNIQAGTIKEISGRSYTFSLPSMQENETKIVSVGNGSTDLSKLGYGGQPFDIVLSNGRLGGYGSRITPSPMLPYALEVIELQRMGTDTDHVKYTVIYRGNMQAEKSIPADALPINGYMYKLNATRSPEFGQNYDSWEASGATNRQFVAQITTAEFQTHYHMTDQACRFAGDTVINKDGKWALDNLDKMVEYIGIKSPLAPSIKTYSEFLINGGSPSADVIGFKYLTTLFDKISMGMLEKQIVNTMVWDPGGITGSDGADKSYIHPGVWHQMDYSGYKRVFSIPTFRKEIILAAIRDFRVGKQDPTEYGKEPVYKIKTGDAGIQLLNAAFKEEFTAQASGLIAAEAIGQYKGNYQVGIDVYTPWYRSITIAGQFKLMWEKDPSLDPTRGDETINPMVGSFRLSSYAMIIEDANFSASNILILRNKFNGGGGMRMEVVNGTRSHPLFQMTGNGIPIHQGSGLQSGFGAYFRASPDTALVWDPTRLLKLSPINPNTGRAVL